jgi:hypothetical protein
LKRETTYFCISSLFKCKLLIAYASSVGCQIGYAQLLVGSNFAFA